jgi:hypothetical protein
MKGLRIVYLVEAVYLTILGVMFMFVPSIAEAIFQTDLLDPILTPLFGQVLISLAIACFIIAQDVAKYIKITWALIFENVGHVAVFLYLLIVGDAGFVTVGPPMIISAILAVLFFVYFRKASS